MSDPIAPPTAEARLWMEADSARRARVFYGAELVAEISARPAGRVEVLAPSPPEGRKDRRILFRISARCALRRMAWSAPPPGRALRRFPFGSKDLTGFEPASLAAGAVTPPASTAPPQIIA